MPNENMGWVKNNIIAIITIAFACAAGITGYVVQESNFREHVSTVEKATNDTINKLSTRVDDMHKEHTSFRIDTFKKWGGMEQSIKHLEIMVSEMRADIKTLIRR